MGVTRRTFAQNRNFCQADLRKMGIYSVFVRLRTILLRKMGMVFSFFPIFANRGVKFIKNALFVSQNGN
jgi:hypothetical protein